MSQAPVATDYTLEFVLANLPEGARDVLEVGCGNGELAARLMERGLRVVAVDANAECVEAARSRGIDARLAEWPADLGETFDALLFTRSLHHVHDLTGGLAAARAATRPGGRLIVEDLRIEGGSARSGDWFRSLARTLLAAGAFGPGFDLDHVLAKLDVNWEEHELHPSSAIASALRHLGGVVESDSAYYFRYLEAELDGVAANAALLRHEIELLAAGCIDPLGKRFVTTL